MWLVKQGLDAVQNYHNQNQVTLARLSDMFLRANSEKNTDSHFTNFLPFPAAAKKTSPRLHVSKETARQVLKEYKQAGNTAIAVITSYLEDLQAIAYG
jgi:indole-3-glycerol phosphate synthase